MVKKIKLSNGLRIVFVPQKGPTATVLVLVETGSEYETKNINGLSHFLEHMCFKGTKKRPKPGMISRELDALGAESNAFTNQEYTGYWAKVEKRRLEKMLELVSDLYLNPIFNPEEIEKERGVVTEELNMYEDTPTRKAGEIWNNLMYGDQPTGWDIGGTKNVIKRMKRDDFIKYRAKHYVASKTIVVVGGNFDSRRVEKFIRGQFGKLPKKPREGKPRTKFAQKNPRAIVKFKKSEQDHLVLGVPGLNAFDRRRYVLYVLAHVLGGGMSSRLFHRIREELGAAYYVRASSDESLDHGEFAVASGTNHAKTELVIRAILEEFEKLKREIVPDKELKKAKDHMTSGIVMGLETSEQLANFYGFQELIYKKMVSPEEIIRKIQAVSAKEVQALAKVLFKKNLLNLAVIGPYTQVGILKKLLTIR